MKQSKMTGKYIFEEMLKLQKEIDEIGKGLDSVESDLGTYHIAYKLLKEQYETKQREFQALERKEYVLANAMQAPALPDNTAFNF